MQIILSTGKCGLWQWQAKIIEGQIGKVFSRHSGRKSVKVG